MTVSVRFSGLDQSAPTRSFGDNRLRCGPGFAGTNAQFTQYCVEAVLAVQKTVADSFGALVTAQIMIDSLEVIEFLMEDGRETKS